MSDGEPGVRATELGLLTDYHQFSMVQAYLAEGMTDTAVFDLQVRALPAQRNYLVACGQGYVMSLLENLRFGSAELSYLESLGRFSHQLLDYLANFRFSGEVQAMPEGSVAFAGEPLLEVVAPLPEGQLVESLLLNQVHFQTLVASKAARVVQAATGLPVVDFGLRRCHGMDAALMATRAAYIAGVTATSNLLAGRRLGIPVTGTMGHSYVMAHEDEAQAFRRFAAQFPDTVLLVDGDDVAAGLAAVIALAAELGKDFHVRSIRLDSGEMAPLARDMLYQAGLDRVGIIIGGDLDEWRIAELLSAGAPINGFGVGSRLGTSADAPYLQCDYRLVSYAGRSRMRLSSGKGFLPGRKQVYRELRNAHMAGDRLGLAGEQLTGRPLLQPIMCDGLCVDEGCSDVHAARARCTEELGRLSPELAGLEPVASDYPVELSLALTAERDHLIRRKHPTRKLEPPEP